MANHFIPSSYTPLLHTNIFLFPSTYILNRVFPLLLYSRRHRLLNSILFLFILQMYSQGYKSFSFAYRICTCFNLILYTKSTYFSIQLCTHDTNKCFNNKMLQIYMQRREILLPHQNIINNWIIIIPL